MIIFNLLMFRVIKSKGRQLQNLFSDKLVNMKNQNITTETNEIRDLGAPKRIEHSQHVSVSAEVTSNICKHHLHRQESLKLKKLQLKKGQNDSLKILFHKREFHAAKSLFAGIGLFILAWLPYFSVILVNNLSSSRFYSPLLTTLASSFSKSLVVINPLVYTISNSKVKLYIMRSLMSGVAPKNQI